MVESIDDSAEAETLGSTPWKLGLIYAVRLKNLGRQRFANTYLSPRGTP